MERDFFLEQFSQLRSFIDLRFNSLEQRLQRLEQRIEKLEERVEKLEQRMDRLEQRMDRSEQRLDNLETFIQRIGIEVEAMRHDIRLIAEGHVMLGEKFTRFESEYLRLGAELKHDLLNLYKITYGELERRVKALETSKPGAG